jgi:hypothetical protein
MLSIPAFPSLRYLSSFLLLIYPCTQNAMGFPLQSLGLVSRSVLCRLNSLSVDWILEWLYHTTVRNNKGNFVKQNKMILFLSPSTVGPLTIRARVIGPLWPFYPHYCIALWPFYPQCCVALWSFYSHYCVDVPVFMVKKKAWAVSSHWF